MSGVHRTLIALALAASVALAGCSGLVPGDDATDREPYEVDDGQVSPNSSPDYLVPGVTNDGVQNASLVLQHNTETLESLGANGTYAVTRTVRTTDANGTPIRTERERVTIAADGGWAQRLTIVTHENGTETVVHRVEAWSDGSEVLVRSERATDVTYRSTDDSAAATPLETYLAPLLLHLSSATVDRRAANGSLQYVAAAGEDVTADGIERVRAVFRPDGVIVNATIERTRGATGSQRRVETIAIADVDAPPVERPEWYEAALEATGEADDGE